MRARDVRSQPVDIITAAVHGDRAGEISRGTDRCEELFAKTPLAGITNASCPPADPEAVDAEAYYQAVTNGISTDLKLGNVNIAVTNSDAPAICSIDFGSHSYRPNDPEIATVRNHLAAKGFEVSIEGSKLSFCLTDPDQISALREFEAAQKERNALIAWKSSSS